MIYLLFYLFCDISGKCGDDIVRFVEPCPSSDTDGVDSVEKSEVNITKTQDEIENLAEPSSMESSQPVWVTARAGSATASASVVEGTEISTRGGNFYFSRFFQQFVPSDRQLFRCSNPACNQVRVSKI